MFCFMAASQTAKRILRFVTTVTNLRSAPTGFMALEKPPEAVSPHFSGCSV